MEVLQGARRAPKAQAQASNWQGDDAEHCSAADARLIGVRRLALTNSRQHRADSKAGADGAEAQSHGACLCLTRNGKCKSPHANRRGPRRRTIAALSACGHLAVAARDLSCLDPSPPHPDPP